MNKNSGTLTARAQKNIFFSYGGYKNIFLPTHHQQLFESTYFRMNYLSKPIPGFLLLTSQLFLGRVRL